MEGAWKNVTGLIVVAMLALLAGCQTSGNIEEENKKLWTQNRELQTQLEQERAARIAAVTANNNAVAQLNRLLGDHPATGAPGDAAANTGFNAIEGVETGRSPNGNIFVRVSGDVLFAPGQIGLKTTAVHTLDQIVQVLKRDYAGKTIRIEGYTDTDPIRRSSWVDNLELSQERAASVYRYLKSKGIDAAHMYAAGFGEQNPRPTKPQSRRVEIVVVAND